MTSKPSALVERTQISSSLPSARRILRRILSPGDDGGERFGECCGVGDGLAAGGGDDIALFEAGAGGGAVFVELGDLGSLAAGIGGGGSEEGGFFLAGDDAAAERGVVVDEDIGGAVQAFLDIAADAGVDADEPAVHVENRSAGVAADEFAIGLHGAVLEADDAADADDRAAFFVVAAGMAEGIAPVAELEFVVVAERHMVEGAGVEDAGHAGVGTRHEAERFALGFLAAGEDEIERFAGLHDDVGGGEDQAIRANDDAAAGTTVDLDANQGFERLGQGGLQGGLDGAQVVGAGGQAFLVEAGVEAVLGRGQGKRRGGGDDRVWHRLRRHGDAGHGEHGEHDPGTSGWSLAWR